MTLRIVACAALFLIGVPIGNHVGEDIMASVASGRATWGINFTTVNDRHELADTVEAVVVNDEYNYNTGDGGGQINKAWHDIITCAPGSTILDLSSLVDVFGEPVDFSTIRVIYITLPGAPVGGGIYVQPSSVFGWTACFGAQPSNKLLCPTVFHVLNQSATGWAVSPTAFALDLVNPGASSVDVTIFLAGS